MSARWVVARWEFMRYFNFKQELIGIAIMIALGLAIGGGAAWIESAKHAERYTVAVLDRAGLAPTMPADSRIKLVPIAEGNQPWVRAQVGLGQTDALLSIDAFDRAELLVHREPGYRKALEEALNQARRQRELARDGVSDEVWQRWNAPVALSVSYHEQGEQPATQGDRIAVFAFLIMLLSGVMTCFAYFFTSITSEKQARVTELIVSAIPAQAWIDGKILGICGLGLKAMLTIALWAGLVAYAVHVFAPETLAQLGGIGVDKALVGVLFLMLGLLFWGAFFAGVAATIDDPNHSTRTGVMLTPAIPVMLALLSIGHVDNVAVTAMSWIPVTSMAFMPLRYALTEVAWWEVAGSTILLAACAWWMRRYASRIFRAGMFLYGKEPSWREILRWMRRAGASDA